MAASPAPHRPTIAVSMGDPLGIGPEVVVKALANAGLRSGARFVIWGCEGPMLRAALKAKIDPFWVKADPKSPESIADLSQDVVVVQDARADAAMALLLDHPRPPTPCAEAGAASFTWVESAIACAKTSPPFNRPSSALRADAIVTGPISKEAWALAGHGSFAGHTELLAARFHSKKTRMMFVAPELMVILVTTHIPLAQVPGALTVERIRETIELGAEACRTMGIEMPRIGVCGVNPHAGEHGLIGDEDRRTIAPAIEAARALGINATGPWPGDTIFRKALDGGFDLVVAMYHDQGLIPVKLVAFDHAVNATIGLPVPRTSPDHGTAFDIAGRGIANPGSMAAAITLALDLAAAPISS